MPSFQSMGRLVVILVYLTILVGEVAWAGIAPLAPGFAARFSLTDPESGLVFAVASLAILVISLPAGFLVRRIGSRAMTLSAIGAMAAGDLAIGLADSFLLLLAGRAIFGLGFGALWVGGIAWMHDASGDRSARVLSLTTTVLGVGSLLGPALTGLVAERSGPGIPFLILGVVTLVVAVPLAAERSTRQHGSGDAPPVRGLLRAACADHLVVTSVVLPAGVAVLAHRGSARAASPRRERPLPVTYRSRLLRIVADLHRHERTDRPEGRALRDDVGRGCIHRAARGLHHRGRDQHVDQRDGHLPADGGGASGIMIAITFPLGIISAREGTRRSPSSARC